MPRKAEKTPRAVAFAAAIQIKAAAAPAEGEAPNRATFSIDAYNGGSMMVGFYAPVIVDLSGMKAERAKLPILLDHENAVDSVFGQTEKIEITADGVKVTGIVTSDSEDAASVVANAANGFEWQASIGASIDSREIVEAGKKATVNGKEVTGPMIIARTSTLKEISITPIGADPTTVIKIAASRGGNPKESDMNEQFKAWLTAKGFDPEAISDTQKSTLEAAWKAETDAAKPAPSDLNGVLKAAREKQARTTKITELTAAALQTNPDKIDLIQAMSEQAIAGDWAADKFDLELLRATRGNVSPAAFRSQSEEINNDTLEAAVAMSCGIKSPEKHFKPNVIEAAAKRWRNGIGLGELMQITARANGHNVQSTRDVAELLRASFDNSDIGRGRGGMNIRAGGFSTISLPGILSNVANKFLLEGFLASDMSWKEIAKIGSTTDFKQTSSYRLTGNLKFKEVAPDGEIPDGELGELAYTNQVRTYGIHTSITRQDIINDDLGAISDVPREIGVGGGDALNEKFWTTFLANTGSFFGSGNSNVTSGGGSALSSSALSAALVKFRKQTKPNGTPVGVEPVILLVPPELEVTAMELYRSTYVNTGGSSTTDKVPNANVFSGKFRPVVCPFLSAAAFSGYSATAWYLLADPNRMATMEVRFLNGIQQPTIESAQADFNQLGVQMRGFWDFGPALQEYRAGVRAAGV